MRRQPQIKVLIVDDSALFRTLLARGLSSDSSIQVVGTARNPYEAADRMERDEPDVMLCDVEMPRMNGVEFIRQLMPQHPLPVIVVSTVTEAIFDALRAGAVDFVAKPNMQAVGEVERFIFELIKKVKIAASSNYMQPKSRKLTSMGYRDASYGQEGDIIVVGASTGGTSAVHQLLEQLPPRMPGIAIVQHIPSVFSRMFAERMNATTDFHVKEAQSGDRLQRGTVIIAPGDEHIRVVRSGGGYAVNCDGADKVNGHRPSVDILFESAAKQAGARVIAVLLTGMGYDGVKGMLAIRRYGGRTIGQDAATSVVYGMPKAAYDVGAVQYQLPLQGIAAKICSLLTLPPG